MRDKKQRLLGSACVHARAGSPCLLCLLCCGGREKDPDKCWNRRHARTHTTTVASCIIVSACSSAGERGARTGMTGKAAPLPTQRDKEDWAHTGAPSKRAMVNRQGRAKKKQAINGELHSNDNHAATGDTQGEREGRPRASGTTPQHAKVWVRGPQEIRAHARPRRRHDRSTDRPAEHRGQETRPHLSTSAL